MEEKISSETFETSCQTRRRHIPKDSTSYLLDFKLLPCSGCCIFFFFFWWFPSVWIVFLLTPPTKMEHKDRPETSAYKIQMPGNHPKEIIQIHILFDGT